MYFDDLAAGKDVSGYGTQPEKAYTPKRQKGDKMAYTGGVTGLPGSISLLIALFE